MSRTSAAVDPLVLTPGAATPLPDPTALATASSAAFLLAALSAVTGFGGGVLLLPVFTALFGVRVAVPALTLAQLASNGSRVWFNRHDVRRGLVVRFALGAVPTAVAGAWLFGHAPLAALQRLLGAFLLLMVAWRRWRGVPSRPSATAFVVVGAGSRIGSALLGSVGPLTAPFFLAYGLTAGAYIGTEAAGALVLHVAKLIGYGAGDLLDPSVLALGAALAPAMIAGAWVGKRVVGRLSERVFVVAVELALVSSAVILVLRA